MAIIETFSDKIETFVSFNRDYLSFRKLPDGSTVLVSNKADCHFPYMITRICVVEDSMDDFSDRKVYFLVYTPSGDSVQILPEEDYWAMYNEQSEMNKIYEELEELYTA